MKQGTAETLLLIQYGQELGLGSAVPEFKFAAALKREFRADIGYPQEHLLIELEGGNWTRGRHTRGQGYEKDCEKYSIASILGYTLIRVTYGMIQDGRAYQLMKLFAERIRE